MNTRYWPLPLLIAPCLLVAAAGCSESGSSGPSSARQGSADVEDPLAAAPSEWPAFLSWAEKKLQTPPAPVPLPDSPALPQPHWPLLHLDDPITIRKARKSSDWTAPPTGQSALAEVGPFRTDQKSNSALRVTTVNNATPEGKDSLSLTFSGFEVQREEVGSIELTLSVPFGEHITLKWSKAGSVLVPVESHDEPFAVRVLTDGFAEWEGPLSSFTILADGASGGSVIEIQTVRFMPREHSYPLPIGVKRARLGCEIRTAIYAHCPAEIAFENLVLPSNPTLRVGIGYVSGSGNGAAFNEPASKVTFEVEVTHDGNRRTVLAEQIDATDVWTDISASLASWGGKEVTVTLKCSSTAPDSVALWANPIIFDPPADPPIIVLYLIDTVSAQHVNIYGHRRETMPRLTAMAAGGVWFSQMSSNSSRTIESIPDLMLSMPVERHGVHHNSTPAPKELVTIAEALRAAGFATASFCTNVNAGPRQGMDQGFDTFVDKIGYYWTGYDRTIPLDEVVDWIETHRDRPMFLYIHTAEPHAPYTPPEGFAGRFDPDYTGRIDGTYNRATTFRNIRDPRAQSRDLHHVKALYDEEILYSDARFGLFLDTLSRMELLDKTHFFVTSDHGEEFLQHGMWEHGLDLHVEQMRVPLIAYGPTFKNAQRVNAPAQLFDLFPTILDMFGLPAPYQLEGRSLLPLLLREGSPDQPAPNEQAAETLLDALRKRSIYASNHNYRISHRLIEYSVAKPGRWKLLYGWPQFPMYAGGPTSHFRLFDLKSDQFELTNVIHDRQDVARRLIENLLRWRLAQRPYDVDVSGPTDIDADHMAQLEALGYVGDKDP